MQGARAAGIRNVRPATYSKRAQAGCWTSCGGTKVTVIFLCMSRLFRWSVYSVCVEVSTEDRCRAIMSTTRMDPSRSRALAYSMFSAYDLCWPVTTPSQAGGARTWATARNPWWTRTRSLCAPSCRPCCMYVRCRRRFPSGWRFGVRGRTPRPRTLDVAKVSTTTRSRLHVPKFISCRGGHVAVSRKQHDSHSQRRHFLHALDIDLSTVSETATWLT